jgi:hypothetical protein
LVSSDKVVATPFSETSALGTARAALAMVPVFPRAASNSDRLDSASTPALKVTKIFSNYKEGAVT